jgi:hypothetical protein
MTISAEAWIKVIRAEYQTIHFDPQPPQPRKQGLAPELLASVFQQLDQTFAFLNQQQPPKLADYTELALHVASLLFSLGAAPAEWKKWLALSSFGYFLQQALGFARVYAVLADEWPFLATLPKHPSPTKQTAVQCFEKLLGLAVEIEHKLPGADMRTLYEEYEGYSYNDYCVLLTEAIPAQAYAQIESCLIHIYQGWSHIDWDKSEPELYPEFEPVPCALAALAYRAGYRPQQLPPEVQRFYELGLTVGPTQNLYAKFFGP